MNWSNDMLDLAECRLVRIEMDLLGLPGRLSEMKIVSEGGGLTNLFDSADDDLIAEIDGIDAQDGSFAQYYRRYYKLKDSCCFLVRGFGYYALCENTKDIIDRVEEFNRELCSLRRRVSEVLYSKYGSTLKRDKICRFNPRVKLGIYLLPNMVARDPDFVKQLHRAFKDMPERDAEIVEWLLRKEDSVRRMGNVKKVQMSAKNEIVAAMLLDKLDFQTSS